MASWWRALCAAELCAEIETSVPLICCDRSFKRFEISDMNDLTVHSDHRTPFPSSIIPKHPARARFIALRIASIMRIPEWVWKSKVAAPVIMAGTIYVIHLFVWAQKDVVNV
jgi:hypothetical protein